MVYAVVLDWFTCLGFCLYSCLVVLGFVCFWLSFMCSYHRIITKPSPFYKPLLFSLDILSFPAFPPWTVVFTTSLSCVCHVGKGFLPCTCMCVCVLYVCTCVNAHVCMHACVCIHMCMGMYTHVHVYICVYMCMYVMCVYVCIHICMCYACVCLCTYLYVCVEGVLLSLFPYLYPYLLTVADTIFVIISKKTWCVREWPWQFSSL